MQPDGARQSNGARQPADRTSVRAACGAPTGAGAPCRMRPMANGRCRLHGGAPQTQGSATTALVAAAYHGTRLADRLAERAAAPEAEACLLSLLDELGLVDAHMSLLL